MAELFSVRETFSRATTAQSTQLSRTQMRRTLGCLLNPKPTSARYYCLHFAANISASCALLKRRVKYISDSESCESSDSEEDKYPPGKGYKVYEPHVVEFPSYAAMEEEKFWHELLAFPWQRGRTERFRRRLEQKYFPKHGLDSMLLPAFRKKAIEASSSKTVSSSSSSSSSSSVSSAGFPDDRVYKKLDYPTIAKALSPGAEGHESFRSQRSRPSSAKKGANITADGLFDTSPSIRTIRAPLLGHQGLAAPSAHSDDAAVTEDVTSAGGGGIVRTLEDRVVSSTNVDIEQKIQPLDDHQDDTFADIPFKPPILKRGMDLPEDWNVPGGTVILIDKPKGWTSFDVCAKVRKLVKVKKVGHAGTLDPMATGLLVVCVGSATKLADRYQALTKVYTGTFRLGEATPSCDADSPVNERKPWEHIMDTHIQSAKNAFIGEIMQIPPMFSAIKVDGERLYEKARRGEHLDIPARKVTVYEFWIGRNKEDRQELDFYVRCSKGTYIRSLVADFARALKSCAHLTSLRREKIGQLRVEDAWPFQVLADTYSNLYRKSSPDK
eukprot:c3503_g1_i1 orf=1046-2707(-)